MTTAVQTLEERLAKIEKEQALTATALFGAQMLIVDMQNIITELLNQRKGQA